MPVSLTAESKTGQPDREVIGSKDPKVFGPLWRQLVLRLCLFHALLLERRHYRGLGWRLPYDFSAADFGAAIKQVLQLHAEFGNIGNQEAELDAINRSLPGLLYVDGQCLYGGKVCGMYFWWS
jgi:dynein heavy chain